MAVVHSHLTPIAPAAAAQAALGQPQNGYAIPGLSFTPNQLFREIRRHVPQFAVRVSLDANMSRFAALWPDTLSTREAANDLGYSPQVGLAEMVELVLRAHWERRAASEDLFRTIDEDGDGALNRDEITRLVRKIMMLGRQDYGWVVRRDDMVDELVERAMANMDEDQDGLISIHDFQAWSKRNTVLGMVETFVDEKVEAGFALAAS